MTKIKRGDKVKLINCAEADDYSDIIFECITDSWKLGNGQEVIRITSSKKDFRGGFAVNRLMKVK
jgi:hypothetical protein